jgi:pimeloyl-ACP methyl ester carboxylesterase
MKNDFSVSKVLSKDGTSIGYRRYGQGTGLVLVNGAVGTAHNYSVLAETLADFFTVYIPDRRGRGMSPLAYSKDYCIQKDIDDLQALLEKTGAHFVYGLSSGAVIALTAAVQIRDIHKLAVFEPPLFAKHRLPKSEIARYDKAIAKGDLARALIAGMKAVRLGPPIFNFMPDWMLLPMFNRILKAEDKMPRGDFLTMRESAPTIAYDLKAVSEMHASYKCWSAIQAKILLMGGGKSPEYLKADLDVIADMFPQAERITFPKLGHAASWNYDKQRNPTGDPVRVAKELQRFFGSDHP